MTGYVCKGCPIAFEIGWHGYRDGSGCCSQYVCCACGTMHFIEHVYGQPDVLFALPGPIPAMVEVTGDDGSGEKFTDLHLPFPAESWRRIGELPTAPAVQHGGKAQDRIHAVALERIVCAFCGTSGRLVSEEWPTDERGNWPVFGERCPRCGGELESIYVTSIY